MVGRKSTVLFDSIDLQILETLSNTHSGMGVLELGRAVNLTHQSLKKHIEKLLRSRLILTLDSQNESRKIKLATLGSGLFEVDSDTSKNELEAIEEFNTLMGVLRRVNVLDYEKEELSKIISDLKKKKQ